MKRGRSRAGAVMCIVLAATWPQTSTAEASHPTGKGLLFSIKPIFDVSGEVLSTSVDDKGDAVAAFESPGAQLPQSSLYTGGHAYQLRPPSGDAGLRAYAMDDGGQIAATAYKTAATNWGRAYVGVLRGHTVSWKPLPWPKHVTWQRSEAMGVSPRGSISGYGYDANGKGGPALWTMSGKSYVLRMVPRGSFLAVEATLTDDLGDTAGQGFGQYLSTFGLFWNRGAKPALLNSAPGINAGPRQVTTLPHGMTVSGTAKRRTVSIVGAGKFDIGGQYTTSPCLWQIMVRAGNPVRAPSCTRLNDPSGGGSGLGAAMGINAKGWIVGWSRAKAVLWINKRALLLNSLISAPGINLTEAEAVNGKDQVLAYGAGGTGTASLFLMTPR